MTSMSGSMPLAWIERPDGVKYRAVVKRSAPSLPRGTIVCSDLRAQLVDLGLQSIEGVLAERGDADVDHLAFGPAGHRLYFDLGTDELDVERLLVRSPALDGERDRHADVAAHLADSVVQR